MRILLVEDDQMIGKGLSDALAAEGMSVDWVRTAADAAGALFDDGHAVVLLDLGLPDGAGLDLLRAVLAAGARPLPC